MKILIQCFPIIILLQIGVNNGALSSKNNVIKLPPLKIYFESSTNQSPLTYDVCQALKNGLDQKAYSHFGSFDTIRLELLSKKDVIQNFQHNLNTISKALALSKINSGYTYSINPCAIEDHLTLLKNCTFLASSTDYLTKQFLIGFMNIFFDNKGNYIGIHAKNKDKVLQNLNNYLRTFHANDTDYRAFLRQLIAQGKSEFQEVLDYHLQYGSKPLPISTNYSSIDTQFKKLFERLTTNKQVQCIKEVIRLCNLNDFKAAQALANDFNRNNPNLSQDNFAQYLPHIVNDYHTKFRELHPELYPLPTLLKGPYSLNIARGLSRTCAKNASAPLYTEWFERCKDALAKKYEYPYKLPYPLHQLECHTPTTETQKKLEYRVLTAILNLDKKIINNGTNNSNDDLPQLLYLIHTWNSCTGRGLSDSFIEEALQALEQKMESIPSNTSLNDPRIITPHTTETPYSHVSHEREIVEIIPSHDSTLERMNVNLPTQETQLDQRLNTFDVHQLQLDHSENNQLAIEIPQVTEAEITQAKILEGHLENIKVLQPAFQNNFKRGLIRALSDDQCALYYLEWTKRSYGHILQNRNAIILQLACNFPTTLIQQTYEKVFMQHLLRFDQVINPAAKALASMSKGIRIWNQATSYPSSESNVYIEKVFKNLPEVTVEFSLPTFDLKDIPLTNPLSRSDEYQLVESARHATSEQCKQLPPHTDKNDKLVIEATRDAMRSITYHKAIPYNSADSDTIRIQKYNQRYHLALHKFKEASRLIQNPQSQQKLFDTLMHDVRHEYEKVYKSFSRMLVEQIDHTIDHCTELVAKGQFAELTSHFEQQENNEKVMGIKYVTGKLTSQQKKEYWAQYVDNALVTAPLSYLTGKAFTGCLSVLKFTPHCTGIIRKLPTALRNTYRIIRPAEAFASARRLMQPQRARVPALAGIRQSDQVLKMNNSEIPKVPRGPKPALKPAGAVDEIERGITKTPNSGPQPQSEVAKESVAKAPATEGTAQVVTQVDKASEKAAGKIKKPVLDEPFTHEQLKNPTTIPGNFIMREFSQEAVEEGIKYATTNEKIHHIFKKPMHNLEPLVAKLGNHENVLRTIIHELQGKVFHNEIFKDLKITVEGFEVYVRGSIIGGIPKLGTFFIKK